MKRQVNPLTYVLVVFCMLFIAACGPQFVEKDTGETVQLPEKLSNANHVLDHAANIYRTGIEEAAEAYVEGDITTQEWNRINTAGTAFHDVYHTANGIAREWMEAIIKDKPFTKRDALSAAMSEISKKQESFQKLVENIVGEVIYGD